MDETSFEAGEFNSREEFAKNRFKDKRTAWSVCGKLYKKELLLATMTQFETSGAIQKTRFLAFWFGKKQSHCCAKRATLHRADARAWRDKTAQRRERAEIFVRHRVCFTADLRPKRAKQEAALRDFTAQLRFEVAKLKLELKRLTSKATLLDKLAYNRAKFAFLARRFFRVKFGI